jgi:hypothetical protein
MNKRRTKKLYKKLYSYDFIYNKIKAWLGNQYFTIKIAFYDVKNKNIGIILNNYNHGYYDILEGILYF